MKIPGAPEASRRPQRSAQEKSRILAAYRRSGQTQKAFCREQAIPVATLAVWLKRAREPALVEVPVLARPGGEIVIEVHAGLRVRAPVGSSVAWLRELIGALRCGG